MDQKINLCTCPDVVEDVVADIEVLKVLCPKSDFPGNDRQPVVRQVDRLQFVGDPSVFGKHLGRYESDIVVAEIHLDGNMDPFV